LPVPDTHWHLVTATAHQPKPPSRQGQSDHSPLTIPSLLRFYGLITLVAVTAAAANIPIRRRRALKSRESEPPKSPRGTCEFRPAIRAVPEATVAAAVGSSHGGDSQLLDAQPAPRCAPPSPLGFPPRSSRAVRVPWRCFLSSKLQRFCGPFS
jgi:hypothetical protein